MGPADQAVVIGGAEVMSVLGTIATSRTFTFRGAPGVDPVLLVVVCIILALGIVMVTSASYIIALGKFGDGFHYAKKQGLAVVIGLGVMYLFSMIRPAFWATLAPSLMALGLVLLLLVFIPGLGVEMGGAHRWIRLPFGFSVQPSEFV